MKTKKNSPTTTFFNFFKDAVELLPLPFETPYAWVRRANGTSRQRYSQLTNRMQKSGLVQIVKKKDRKFIKLTNKGQLRALVQNSRLPHSKQWDGKWRLVMFDIPEQNRTQRNQLRALLKGSGFVKLQQSVLVSPYPINRHGIGYLKRTGLINYIRILRVDEMDDEKELLLKFKLKKSPSS